MCTHGHPHISSHGPLKTTHLSPILTRLCCGRTSEVGPSLPFHATPPGTLAISSMTVFHSSNAVLFARVGFPTFFGICGDLWFVVIVFYLFPVSVAPKPFGSFEKSCSRVGIEKRRNLCKVLRSRSTVFWKTTPRPGGARQLLLRLKPELCSKQLQRRLWPRQRPNRCWHCRMKTPLIRLFHKFQCLSKHSILLLNLSVLQNHIRVEAKNCFTML